MCTEQQVVLKMEREKTETRIQQINYPQEEKESRSNYTLTAQRHMGCLSLHLELSTTHRDDKVWMKGSHEQLIFLSSLWFQR